MEKKEISQIRIPRHLLFLSRFSLSLEAYKGPILFYVLSFLALLGWLFFPTSLSHKIDFWAYDSWLKFLPPLKDPRVVILSIDEETLKTIGPWPWPRKVHARVVERLKAAGAKAVVFDIVFSPPREEDRIFAQSFQGVRVVLAAYAEEVLGRSLTERGIRVSRLVLPAPILQKYAFAMGHVALIFDQDGIVRRVPAFLADERLSLPALGLAGALAYHGEKLSRVSFFPKGLEEHGFRIPFNPDGSFFIRYYGPRGTFPTLRLRDLLEGKIPGEIFEGRLAIIGVTAVGISDEWPTPYIDQGSLPGVEIHASIVQSLLDHQVPRALFRQGQILGAWMILTITFSLLLYRPSFILLSLGFPVILWALGMLVFRKFFLFVTFSPYIGAWCLGLISGWGTELYRQHFRTQREERFRRLWQEVLANLSLEKAASYFSEKYEARRVVLFLANEEVREIHEWPRRGGLIRPGEKTSLAREFFRDLEKKGGLFLEVPVEGDEKLCLWIEGQGPLPRETIAQELQLLALLLRQRRLIGKLQKSEEEFISSYLRLLEERYPELYEHSLRVAEITEQIAERLRLPPEEKKALRYAALLHDLGLIEIPDEEPWRALHPLLAADILGGVSFLRKSVVYIRHHHERYDGQGYPDGLRGEEIPFGARILAVAEGFVEAWERWEKEAEDLADLENRILQYLQKEAGKRFDPHLVQILVQGGSRLEET